ncbi:hypothetical protein CVD19_03285 [Bacillus sp. T33-2]|nr:hypothetical protein CVD19_03285 [Bacillus sp. T33-2]
MNFLLFDFIGYSLKKQIKQTANPFNKMACGLAGTPEARGSGPYSFTKVLTHYSFNPFPNKKTQTLVEWQATNQCWAKPFSRFSLISLLQKRATISIHRKGYYCSTKVLLAAKCPAISSINMV